MGLGQFHEDEANFAAQMILGSLGLIQLEEYGISISRFVMLCTGLDLKIHCKTEVTEKRMVVSRMGTSSEASSQTDPRIQYLSRDDYYKAIEFAPMLRRFWPNPDSLLSQRLAKAFVEDGTVVAVCYTCFQFGNAHEPHIVVKEDYRGLGIGKKLSTAYALEMLYRGYRVFWTHTDDNAASARCAESIGLIPYGVFDVQQCIANLGNL